MSSSSNTIVKLNIGGTLYEVSRSLINSFSDSMLCSIVSNKWKEGSEEQIFIERDGHRFRYVLDYMRDGNVNLPRGECTKSLFTELDYFGIEYDSNKISSNDSLNLFEVTRSYRAYLEKFENMKYAHARSHIEILITIDIINKALEKVDLRSTNIEFKIQYEEDSEFTESNLICKFLLYGLPDKKSCEHIFTRINGHILDLGLKIDSYVIAFDEVFINVKGAS